MHFKRYKILKPTYSFSFLRTTDVKSSGESDHVSLDLFEYI